MMIGEEKEELEALPLQSPKAKSGSFYKDFELSKNRKKFREECFKIRCRLEAKKREEERRQHEILEKQRKEMELQKLRQLEAWKREQEEKTKRYFVHNQFHRKIPIEGDPYYFGEFETQCAGWRPHGSGKFVVNNQPVVEGIYNRGDFVRGKIIWKHGYIWEGMMWKNLIHGMGVLRKLRKEEINPKDDDDSSTASSHRIKPAKYNFNKRYTQIQENDYSRSDRSRSSIASESGSDEEEVDQQQFIPREAIACKGEIVCYRDQFQEGLQVQFQEPVLNNYISEEGFLPKVTLLKHVKGWKYLCRFHQETWPRERVVDFSLYNRFKILLHQPRILDLHSLSSGPDALRVHDYRNQDYIVKAIEQRVEANDLGELENQEEADRKYRKTALYRDLVPVVPHRPIEHRRRNIFESREVGIGQAQEEDDFEEQERLKKAQWAKAIAERKAKFVEERQKMYAAEQQKMFESTAAAKKEVILVWIIELNYFQQLSHRPTRKSDWLRRK